MHFVLAELCYNLKVCQFGSFISLSLVALFSRRTTVSTPLSQPRTWVGWMRTRTANQQSYALFSFFYQLISEDKSYKYFGKKYM